MFSEAVLDYFLSVRTQFACLLILQFIVWTFFAVKREKTYGNRLFFLLLIDTLINLVLDMITVYTLAHLDTVPELLNHFLQILYITSSVGILYISYLYVKSITVEHPPMLPEAIPLLLSALCAVMLPMEFVKTPHGGVAAGDAIRTAYICAASYFVVCAALLLRYWKKLESKLRLNIAVAMFSILLTTFAQTARDELDIASVGFTILVIALHYTLASPDALLIETLAYERNRADSANRAKSAFLANMSHEIRTPINAILGMDEMILRESSERGTLSYASDIQAAGRTLLSLINDILDFSKVEEGKMEILPTQYDLGSVVNDLVNMIRDRAEKKGLRFELELDAKAPRLLYGDAIRIRQCALNLLTNAVKYTEKGSVMLAIGYDKLSDDRIALKFRVSDTGIGMKPDDLSQIAAPFTRFDETRFRTVEGTGLGMSITKQLLDLMGGKFDAQSTYGEGSTFSFAVEQPVVRWDPVGKYSAAPDASARRSSYRELFHAPDAHILVVDDTVMNLTVIRALLKKTQIAIDTASSGKEAVRMASERQYDVIFVDHMMPEMDGIETLHELQRLPTTEDSTFIALTANAVSGAREFYIGEGFQDYLSKPVDGERLEDMLVNYLPPEKLSMQVEAAAEAGEARSVILFAGNDEALFNSIQGPLSDAYDTFACRTGEELCAEAERLHPALILLDVQLDGEHGFALLQSLKRNAATCDIPVAFLTDEENADAEALGLRNGAADSIRKAYLPDVLMRRVRRIIEFNHMQTDLQNEVKRQILRAEKLSIEMMLALSKAVDAKDHFTNGHSERVAAYAAEIARRLGKNMQAQEHIYEIGLMHDVGKIGVSEDVINKLSALSDEDFAAIRRHTVIGYDILCSISEMPELAAGARSHHEWYDGSGYPDGLKGSDIPEVARIICVADCYDAMTSTRTHSSIRPQAAVRAEIERCSGTQFDPKAAKAMLDMIDEDVDYQMNEQHGGLSVWKNSSQLWQYLGGVKSELSEEENPEDGVLPAWLREINGLDVDLGIKYCATPESYLETLKVYADTVARNADETERYWLSGDLANTTVKVHAMKSTSRTIGATALGDFAERLELAGKAGDVGTLSAELDTLLTQYRALGKRLAPLLGDETQDDDALPPLLPEELREAYDAILEFCETFDFDSIALTIDSLRGYRVPEEEKERFQRLKDAADNYDWDMIGEIIRKD